MKTLILMRHAKSDWNDSALNDTERPLNARGRDAAPRIGAWLAGAGYRPDVVLCSSAQRTRETLGLMKASLPGDARIEYLRALYLAPPSTMLAEIGKAPATAETVLLLGHNPGIGSLAAQLAGSGEPEALADMKGKFPTAAVAVLGFDAARWSELAPESGRLLAFKRPRDLA